MRTVMRTFHLVLAVAGIMLPASLLTAPMAQAQSMKLGVFDSERVSSETIEGKRLRAELEALSSSKQQEITAMDQNIQNLQQQLSQQALSLSPEKRTGLEMEIRRKLLELNHANELASKELQLEIASAQARFNDKLAAVVATFGRDEQFDLILETSVAVWSAPSTDVTTAVIDRFDKMFPAAVPGE